MPPPPQKVRGGSCSSCTAHSIQSSEGSHVSMVYELTMLKPASELLVIKTCVRDMTVLAGSLEADTPSWMTYKTMSTMSKRYTDTCEWANGLPIVCAHWLTDQRQLQSDSWTSQECHD